LVQKAHINIGQVLAHPVPTPPPLQHLAEGTSAASLLLLLPAAAVITIRARLLLLLPANVGCLAPPAPCSSLSTADACSTSCTPPPLLAQSVAIGFKVLYEGEGGEPEL